jgi:hypothetical protein
MPAHGAHDFRDEASRLLSFAVNASGCAWEAREKRVVEEIDEFN